MPPQNPQWSVSLNASDVIGIAGVIVGLIFGVAGVWIGVLQFRRAKSAESAVREIRQKLFRQQAAQRFSDIAPRVVLLSGLVRVKSWQSCAESATEIGAKLANAVGFCADLKTIEGEWEFLQASKNAVQYILASIPVEDVPIDPQTVQEMTTRCMLILFAVEQVAGRLKASDSSEEST
jgi:hypothetical protein